MESADRNAAENELAGPVEPVESQSSVIAGGDGENVRNVRPDRRPNRWFYPVALALLTVTVFSNAMPNAFIVDDASFAPDPRNPVTFESMLQLFKEDAWASSRTMTGVYRPLSLLTISLESFLHGPSGTGYHAVNVLMHVLATLAVYGLCLTVLLVHARGARRSLGAAWPAAFCAGLVFGVHPIHTEAVDSIFNRSEILATLAVVSGLTLILTGRKRRPRVTWFAVAFLYFVGLLCKESAVTMPALAALLLVVLDSNRRAGSWLMAVRPLAWLAVPLGVYLLLRANALQDSSILADLPRAQGHQAGENLADRLALVAASFRDFLRMMVWPHPLRASYDDYVASGSLAAAVLLVLLAVTSVLLRRRAPGMLLGLGFFYIALLPSSRLVSHYGIVVTIAERYVYLPSVGFSLLLALAAAFVCRRVGAGAVFGATAVVCVPLAVLTYLRNHEWHSAIALWTAEVERVPENPDGWKWLTAAQLSENRVADVAAVCDEQLPRLRPFNPLLLHCAVAYGGVRRDTDAERTYLAAIATPPENSITYKGMARFYANRGRFTEAEKAYQKAVEVERDPVRRLCNRGEMLMRLPPVRLDEAEAEYRAALAIEPRFGTAQEGLANVQRRRAAR